MRTHANDRLKGTLDLLVLKILASHGRMHGYGITLRIEQVSENVLRLERSIERSRTDEVTPVLRKIQDKGSPTGDRQNVHLQSTTNAETFCLSPGLEGVTITEIPIAERLAAAPVRFKLTLQNGGLPAWFLTYRVTPFEEN
jgi:hypothetical protein